MKRSGFIFALVLSLTTRTAAETDSSIARSCGDDRVHEISADRAQPIGIGYYAASLMPMNNPPTFSVIAVTIHLTNRGELIRLSRVTPMISMAECRAWTHQQGFMRVLPGYAATFHYCDCASEP